MDEIIYKVYCHPINPNNLSEEEIEFMVPLEKYDNLYTKLPVSHKIKFLFFNMLFNKIDDDQFESFLDFHFDKYQSDKKDFLRILKWDIDEIFEHIDIPPRTKITKFGVTTRYSYPLKDKELLPFFEDYDYDKYLVYKKHYKKAKHWIKKKNKELEASAKNLRPGDERKEELMAVTENVDIENRKHLLSIPTTADPGKNLEFLVKASEQ